VATTFLNNNEFSEYLGRMCACLIVDLQSGYIFKNLDFTEENGNYRLMKGEDSPFGKLEKGIKLLMDSSKNDSNSFEKQVYYYFM
jgi:hypothetical protein